MTRPTVTLELDLAQTVQLRGLADGSPRSGSDEDMLTVHIPDGGRVTLYLVTVDPVRGSEAVQQVIVDNDSAELVRLIAE